MLRSRKMLGDTGVIDHHADCGFVSSSPAMNYMELYPFINRLWCKHLALKPQHLSIRSANNRFCSQLISD